MGAITGIYYLDERPVASLDMQRMNDSLNHRGADGKGIWSKGAIGLGHQMLWTTPESLNEHLPMMNDRRDLVITADARIDNRDELISILKMDERSPSEISDSELILAAYEEWGEQCPGKLLGDFIFAIWDGRRKSIFCARDQLGIKHFYYYYKSQKIFALASEIKGLLCLQDIPQQLNEFAVADHLLPVYEDKATTFYQDIYRLPSAHCMTITSEGIKISRYYWPDLSRDMRLRSNEEYAEAFREVFTQAIRYRLRSAFPVASMLSGGLDSSSITCVAGKLLAEEGRGPLLTFSGVWPSMAEIDPKSDERRYMNAVTSMGGFEPNYIYADLLSPLTEWKKMLWHFDSALSAPNMYLDWAIFKATQSQGARILLGGTDGDTTVSYGYEDLREFARRGRWVKLVREARALQKHMPRRAHKFKKLVWNKTLQPIIPEYAWQCWRVLRGRPRVVDYNDTQNVYWKTRPINPGFAQRINLRQRFWDLENNSFPPMAKNKEAHWSGINSGMWSYILETFEKGAAAFSVETRYPFFDRKVIEFCLALPPGQKIQNGWTRSIFRRAMAGIIPPEIQWRTDKGQLSAGVNMNLLKRERETLDESFLQNSGIIEDYINLPSLQALYERYKENPMSNNNDPFTLMLVLNLSLWLQASGLKGTAGA